MDNVRYSVNEFAQMKGLQPGSVRKMIERNTLPTGYCVFKESERKRWIVADAFETHGTEHTPTNLPLGKKGEALSREQLELMVTELYNHPEEKAEKVRAIEAAAEQSGVKGFDRKSIYRKLTKLATGKSLSRKMRSDKWTIRNEMLSNSFPKLRALAAAVYDRNTTPNLSILVDIIQMVARNKEEYYEFAAINKSTMYRQLSLDFQQSGLKTLHQYLNHYNLFAKNLPKVHGAFTDDVDFMDYIVGDDHKADVASVYVYDKLERKAVKKQVKIWYWCEAKTMYPLGWIVKVGDITTRDLINSLIPVIAQYGLPNKQFLIDNGIGRSEEFRDFIAKIYLHTNNDGIRFSAPYEPTNKATIERSFGMFKQELDCFQENFVGPNKERESRHRGQSLSPEETELFVDEYRKQYENYINGFYIERPRTRKINGGTQELSLRAYFDLSWRLYQKREVSGKTIRYALSQHEVKVFKNEIVLKKSHFIPATPLPHAFYGEKVLVSYNPDNLREVDIYAANDVLDRATNTIYEKNSYVATFYNIEMHPDRRELVQVHNKIRKQQMRELATTLTNLTELQSLEGMLPGTMAPDGKIVSERDEVKKHIEASLTESILKLPGYAKVDESLQPFAKANGNSNDAEEYSLTPDDSETELVPVNNN